jgi:hypothetical protein
MIVSLDRLRGGDVESTFKNFIDRECSGGCDKQTIVREASSLGVSSDVTDCLGSLPDGRLSRDQVEQCMTGDSGLGSLV